MSKQSDIPPAIIRFNTKVVQDYPSGQVLIEMLRTLMLFCGTYLAPTTFRESKIGL
jgi:hypothetical protein